MPTTTPPDSTPRPCSHPTAPCNGSAPTASGTQTSTQPGSGGEVTLFPLDLDVLDVTTRRQVPVNMRPSAFQRLAGCFQAIFGDNQVTTAALASVSGDIVSFTIDSDDLQDGYLTLGLFPCRPPRPTPPRPSITCPAHSSLKADGCLHLPDPP